MAKIKAVAAPSGIVHPETIRFRMTGLAQDYSEDGVFTLDNVPQLLINYERIVEDLVAQGVDRKLAEDAVEGMAEGLYGKMLAAHIAERMVMA